MNDALTPAQISDLEKDLRVLKQSLLDLLSATESGAQPVKLNDNKGRLTRMAEMHNQSILVANRNVTKKRLSEVAAAIGRISDDTYGYCLACDEPIALARLKAYPEASLCIACKSARE